MNRTSEPLVSIVTPVYNGAEFLVECIESVLAQTYQNWEYIIVNNCSTDESLKIAQRYAARDSRIRIHNNTEFLDVIRNHNAALRQISPASKYCKFVFADDWIFPECVERMVAVSEQFPSIGLVGAYVLHGQEEVRSVGLPYDCTKVDGREICRRHFLEGLHVFESANAVLYRADLVREKAAFYNEKNIHADTESCFSLLKTNDFGFVHQILTYTRVRPESLTHTSTDLQTSHAGMMRILLVHGRDYFSDEELGRLFEKYISNYYQFLGKCLLLGQKKTLKYHKDKLAELGIDIRWSLFAKGMFATIWGLILNPKSAVDKLLKSKSRVNLIAEENGVHSARVR